MKKMMQKTMMIGVITGSMVSALLMPEDAYARGGGDGWAMAASVAGLSVMVSIVGVGQMSEGIVTGSKAVAALPVKAVLAVGSGIEGSMKPKGTLPVKGQKQAWDYSVTPLEISEETVTVVSIPKDKVR